MALICNYSKFGTTFSDAYVRIENLRYVAKPHTKLEYPNKTTDANTGAVVDRGEPVQVVVTDKRLNLIVSIYTSEQARENNETPIDMKTDYICDANNIGSEDILTFSYEYLKTLPEFNGAQDA